MILRPQKLAASLAVPHPAGGGQSASVPARSDMLCHGKPMKFPSVVQSLRSSDCAHVSAVIGGGGSADILQIARGPLKATANATSFGPIRMHYTTFDRLNLCRGWTRKGNHYALIPMQWTGNMVWNGRPIEQLTVFSWDNEFEFFRRAAGTAGFTISISGAAFARNRAAWMGLEPGEMPEPLEGEIALPLTADFQNLLRNTANLLTHEPELLALPAVQRSLETGIITALLRSGDARSAPPRETWSERRNRARVVHQVDAYLRARAGAPVYLLDICQASGVSARAMEYAFREVCGMSPVQYLRMRRLNLANRRLQEAGPAGLPIKAIAFECGMPDLGRFSIDYRNLFGELPSQTRNRCADERRQPEIA